jgi:hypothetical protein
LKYEECYERLIVLTPRKWNPSDAGRSIRAFVLRKDDAAKKVLVQWGLDDQRQTDWYDPADLEPVKRVFHDERVPKSDERFWAAVDPNGNIIAIEKWKKEADHKAVQKYLNDFKIGCDGFYGYSEADELVAEWLGYRSYEIIIPHGLVRKG